MHISRSSRPNIVITMGDPSGIGPEVTVKALASSRVKGLADFFVIGDRAVIERVSGRARIKFTAGLIDLANVPDKGFAYGRTAGVYGRASIGYIDKALELLMRGDAGCLVTGPVNKRSVRTGAVPGFEGHTEYLAARSGAKDYAMMFVGSRLKVALVTRHIPLAQVPKCLTIDKVAGVIALTKKVMERDFKIGRPKIAVLGLNPHAGESGAFGDEEMHIITPAIKKSGGRNRGIYGPLPADVAFYDCLNGKFDACVAMYHDQALAPFKMLYFKDGVNVTVGLPFVRTSPDHGTAFDIAGKGIADPSSMIEAIRLACQLAKLPKWQLRKLT